MNKTTLILYEIVSKLLIIIALLDSASCATDGSFAPRVINRTRPGDDPCNPLYWYPRDIPAYCYIGTTQRPRPRGRPIPVPIPVPAPPFLPPPMLPPIDPYPPPIPFPVMAPPIPLPFGVPIETGYPMLPVAGIRYNPYSPQFPVPPVYHGPPPVPPQYPAGYSGMPPPNFVPSPDSIQPPYPMAPLQRQIGMVPGIPGIVSHDGGINILPFSDAYADLLEKHKQKMIRRRLQKFLDEYERYPWKPKRKN